jgi:hypothetical protein
MSVDDFGEINWVVKDPDRKPRVTVEGMLDALTEKVEAANPSDADLEAKVRTLADLLSQVRVLTGEIRAVDPSILSGRRRPE